MMSASVRVQTNKDAAGALSSGTEAFVMDMATAGFDASQARIASEATDTGQLLKSGIPPQRQPDGSVTWGYGADYAAPVDQGTRPHWPPIEPLLGWARRVLGDERAAYAVQRKIAREGTEGAHFIQRGLDAMRAFAKTKGVGDYLMERL